MAAELTKDPTLLAAVIDGARSEFTVEVDGKAVARKGETLPDVAEIQALVRNTEEGDDG